jgi:hypothetical protein
VGCEIWDGKRHVAWGMEHREKQPFDKLRTGWQLAADSWQKATRNSFDKLRTSKNWAPRRRSQETGDRIQEKSTNTRILHPTGY